MGNREKMIFKDEQSSTGVVRDVLNAMVEDGALEAEVVKEGDTFNIKYVVDGAWKVFAALEFAVYQDFLNRIKILANLKLDNAGKQEGAFTAKVMGATKTFDVSTLPGNGIETIVIKTTKTEKKLIRKFIDYVDQLIRGK